MEYGNGLIRYINRRWMSSGISNSMLQAMIIMQRYARIVGGGCFVFLSLLLLV